MHRPEPMAMDSQSPMAAMDHGLSCVPGHTGFLPSTGAFQMLRELKLRRPGPAYRLSSRHWAMRGLPKIAFRSVVDCLAMALCVLFAALATLLMGLYGRFCLSPSRQPAHIVEFSRCPIFY